jgi:hypothetical protein
VISRAYGIAGLIFNPARPQKILLRTLLNRLRDEKTGLSFYLHLSSGIIKTKCNILMTQICFITNKYVKKKNLCLNISEKLYQRVHSVSPLFGKFNANAVVEEPDRISKYLKLSATIAVTISELTCFNIISIPGSEHKNGKVGEDWMLRLTALCVHA